MLKLYQGTTSVCVCKVRLVLAEKGINWEGELLDLQRGDQFDPAYRKLNPNAVVPTLIHDGNILIESSVIMLYLDEVFPNPRLQPTDPLLRAKMRIWMKTVDEKLHPGIALLTFATAHRLAHIDKTPEQRRVHFSKVADVAAGRRHLETVEQGLDAPHVAETIKVYDKALDDMERTLTVSPWLAGEGYSLADAAVTPYINRLDTLGMSSMWEHSRLRLRDWLQRVRSRSSFQAAITAFVTEHDVKRYAVDRKEVQQSWRQS